MISKKSFLWRHHLSTWAAAQPPQLFCRVVLLEWHGRFLVEHSATPGVCSLWLVSLHLSANSTTPGWVRNSAEPGLGTGLELPESQACVLYDPLRPYTAQTADSTAILHSKRIAFRWLIFYTFPRWVYFFRLVVLLCHSLEIEDGVTFGK